MDWHQIYLFILGLGSFQGLSMAIILWARPSPRKANNLFLALILLFFAYRLLAELLFEAGLASTHNWGYHVLLEYNWIYGCLLYFYILSYLERGFHLKRAHLIHFIPAVAEFIFSNFIKLQNFYWDGTRESLSWAGYWGYVLWEHTPFQVIISLGLVLFYVERSRKRIKQNTQLKETGLRWLMHILLVYRYFSIIILAIALVNYSFYDYAFHPFFIFPAYIGMAAITYWLGMEGFARRKRPLPLQAKGNRTPDGLSSRLKALMEQEAPYRDATLTQATLAAQLAIPPYQLTRHLSEVEQQNFNDYINAYRIEAVKAAIQAPELQHLSLLGMAMEAGFNSKATFNRAVKKATGMTPSQLRDQLQKKKP